MKTFILMIFCSLIFFGTTKKTHEEAFHVELGDNPLQHEEEAAVRRYGSA